MNRNFTKTVFVLLALTIASISLEAQTKLIVPADGNAYQWYTIDGQNEHSISGANFPSYTATSAGVYYARYVRNGFNITSNYFIATCSDCPDTTITLDVSQYNPSSVTWFQNTGGGNQTISGAVNNTLNIQSSTQAITYQAQMNVGGNNLMSQTFAIQKMMMAEICDNGIDDDGDGLVDCDDPDCALAQNCCGPNATGLDSLGNITWQAIEPESGYNRALAISYTGADQSIAIPSGVSSVFMKMWGAGGAASQFDHRSDGGAAGYAQGTMTVTSGDELTFIVGEGGKESSTTPTYGGGGGGGEGSLGVDIHLGSSGGGRSAIRLAGTEVITAGGGGGTGPHSSNNTAHGGAGGGDIAQNGTTGNGSGITAAGGGVTAGAGSGPGGTGGSAGLVTVGSPLHDGSPGTQFQGGQGGGLFINNPRGGGGGGGGGYYGGGGGNADISSSEASGGGGGSGYLGGVGSGILLGGFFTSVPNTGNVHYKAGVGTAGLRTPGDKDGGNGYIVLQWNSPFSLSTTLDTTYCEAGGNYRVVISASGAPPYRATGTGAPGTWVGSQWTSDPIPATTNYEIQIIDSLCSFETISGAVPLCEDCTNGIDDDGDGLVDCEDLACLGNVNCLSCNSESGVVSSVVTSEASGEVLLNPGDTAWAEVTPEAGFDFAYKFYTIGQEQKIAVPTGVDTIFVKMWGAGGAGSAFNGRSDGGAAGYAEGAIPVSSGDILTLIVGEGGNPSDTNRTYGGGGGGGEGILGSTIHLGSSGGGRSAVQLNGLEVVTAGGGGGTGPHSDSNTGHGGAGGGASGQNGVPGNGPGINAAIGGAGSGGTGGMVSTGSPLHDGFDGSQFQGGKGGGQLVNNPRGGGGGGGGGYYGGGGGNADISSSNASGGAGGGGYIGGVNNGMLTAGNLTTVANTSDFHYVNGIGTAGLRSGIKEGGHGMIVIQWSGPPYPTPPEIAGDLIDNDCDGLIDCSDPDLASDMSCYSCNAVGIDSATGDTTWQVVHPESGYNRAVAYRYTGNDQGFTVPTGVDSINVKAWGAGGGGYTTDHGGGGGFIKGVMPTITGDQYVLIVGQGGLDFGSSSGTYGGGGAGGVQTSSFYEGASGGGRSAIRLLGVEQATAGGGGGAAGGQPGQAGAGGGLTGTDGAGVRAGLGGTQTMGGQGGVLGAYSGEDGSAYLGGAGGNGIHAGGGGGGGYHGGGGGAGSSNASLVPDYPGGGGSSYIMGLTGGSTEGGVDENPGGQLDVHYINGIGRGAGLLPTAGTNNGGHGLIIIQWNDPNLTASALCAPTAVDDTASVLANDTLVLAVLQNDTFPTGVDTGSLTICVSSPPTMGIATINANGTISYIPTGSPMYVDSFCYVICDDQNPQSCDSALVVIDVLIPPCTLSSAGLSNIQCDNNGTPGVSTDDIVTFELNPTGSFLSAGYTLSGDLISGGFYGSNTMFIADPGTAGGGDLSITITDDSGDCSLNFNITDPGDCCVAPSSISNIRRK